MRLYHGTGAWDDIRAAGGLIPDAESRTFGDEAEGIASLNGVYMSDRADIAGFYAVKSVNSESYVGGYPGFFVIETDPRSLCADEDKIDFALMRILERGSRIRDGEAKPFMEKLAARRDSVILSVKQDLHLAATISDEEIWEGIRGFVYRKGDCGWPFDLEDQDQDVDALKASIDRLCSAASATIGHGWMSRVFGNDYCLSCRSVEPVTEASGLVGGAQLMMSNDGFSIVGVETFGDVTQDEIDAFKASVIRYFEDISTCTIVDRSAPAGLAA